MIFGLREYDGVWEMFKNKCKIMLEKIYKNKQKIKN